jgi:hypothetical protein
MRCFIISISCLTARCFLQSQVHSWISYKRRRDDEELHESYRISQRYPLIEPNALDTNTQHECENCTSHRQVEQCFESENSSIDSAPSSSSSTPVNSLPLEISSPDDTMQTMCPIQLKSGIWDLTPAFSPMKDACTDENIKYAKHISFSNIKGAIADASAFMDSSSNSMHSPHIMPSLCI